MSSGIFPNKLRNITCQPSGSECDSTEGRTELIQIEKLFK